MPSLSSSPDMRAHCWPGSKMNGIFSVRHSSAYDTIAPGSFGEMMASFASFTPRNDNWPASAIAPV